ncbi:hypothetical protein BO80DRAFT_437869 [Aspergillus ibericus CBS 121593]|uniref:Uncharacterized protein n=1 Tax=Aspergillus ibericus CBS 121593 TaxID=1448316 RepID=A0A395GQS5_9EURO|nr:hypothetical protein BO80DRAFT_437869 [Aspergillus ibericus CBS 121593]RAK97298.1 hypothetical protein BO80DRAFT_437869 [Aspergillus ibericus CBS 121593]
MIPDNRCILMHKNQSRRGLLAACAGSLTKFKDSMEKQAHAMAIRLGKYQRDCLKWEYKLAKAVGFFHEDKVDRAYRGFLVALTEQPVWLLDDTANGAAIGAAEPCWTEELIGFAFPWKPKKLKLVLQNLQTVIANLDEEDGHAAGTIKIQGVKSIKTYNRRDSLVVTHPTTNLPACGLSTAERTGSPVLHTLWSNKCTLILDGKLYPPQHTFQYVTVRAPAIDLHIMVAEPGLEHSFEVFRQSLRRR